MVEIGDTIKAHVSRIEPYGVYLEHPQSAVIVLLPELSWAAVQNPRDVVRLGEELDVLVTGYNYKTREIVGSLRRLHPEKNPYRDLSRLEPGTSLKGKITFADSVSYCVEFPNGARGSLPKVGASGTRKVGDEVEVIITHLAVDDGIMAVSLFEPAGAKKVLAATP